MVVLSTCPDTISLILCITLMTEPIQKAKNGSERLVHQQTCPTKNRFFAVLVLPPGHDFSEKTIWTGGRTSKIRGLDFLEKALLQKRHQFAHI